MSSVGLNSPGLGLGGAERWIVDLRRCEAGRDFGRRIRTIARNAVREELRRRSRYGHRLRVYYESLSVRLVNDDNAECDDVGGPEPLQLHARPGE